MGLLPAIAGYKIDVQLHRDDLEWFRPHHLVTDVMNRHEETDLIDRSLTNKKSKLCSDGQAGLLIKMEKDTAGRNIIFYHRNNLRILLNENDFARGDMVVHRLYPFLARYYHEAKGDQYHLSWIKKRLRRIGRVKLSQLCDDLPRRDLGSELARKILALSPTGVNMLLAWLGHPGCGEAESALPEPSDLLPEAVATEFDDPGIHAAANFSADVEEELQPMADPEESIVPEEETAPDPLPVRLDERAIQQLVDRRMTELFEEFAQRQPSPPKRKSGRLGTIALILCVAIATAFIGRLIFRSDLQYYQHRDENGPRQASMVPAEKGNILALYGWAFTQYENGDLEQSLVTLEEVRKLIRTKQHEAQFHYLRGMIRSSMGDIDDAKLDLNFAASLYESLNDWINAGLASNELARVYVTKNYGLAGQYLEIAQNFFSRSRDSRKKYGEAIMYGVSFENEFFAGNYSKARVVTRKRGELSDNDKINKAYADSDEMMVLAIEGKLDAALDIRNDLKNQNLDSDYFRAYHATAEIALAKAMGQSHGQAEFRVRQYLEQTQNHALLVRLEHILQLAIAPAPLH